MDQAQRQPEPYDFRQYDHIWQRVTPGLEPYPAEQTGSAADTKEAPQSLRARQESRLPGAEPDPCCMGTAAAEQLAVLTGFIEEELEDQRMFVALARQAPGWAVRTLRELAVEEGEHARRLMAVYYLVQGECYRPTVPGCPVRVGPWCAALRERYHAAACNGLNYARAGEESTDPCLTRLLEALSGEEYRQADRLMALLERSLRV